MDTIKNKETNYFTFHNYQWKLISKEIDDRIYIYLNINNEAEKNNNSSFVIDELLSSHHDIFDFDLNLTKMSNSFKKDNTHIITTYYRMKINDSFLNESINIGHIDINSNSNILLYSFDYGSLKEKSFHFLVFLNIDNIYSACLKTIVERMAVYAKNSNICLLKYLDIDILVRVFLQYKTNENIAIEFLIKWSTLF